MIELSGLTRRYGPTLAVDDLVDGRRHRELRAPMRVIGALPDAGAVHPRRSARDHRDP